MSAAPVMAAAAGLQRKAICAAMSSAFA